MCFFVQFLHFKVKLWIFCCSSSLQFNGSGIFYSLKFFMMFVLSYLALHIVVPFVPPFVLPLFLSYLFAVVSISVLLNVPQAWHTSGVAQFLWGERRNVCCYKSLQDLMSYFPDPNSPTNLFGAFISHFWATIRLNVYEVLKDVLGFLPLSYGVSDPSWQCPNEYHMEEKSSYLHESIWLLLPAALVQRSQRFAHLICWNCWNILVPNRMLKVSYF